MGGNALKNTQTQRLDRPAFELVSEIVVRELKRAFPGARVDVIAAYHSKQDFGDLDVLLSSEDMQAAGGGEALQALAKQVFHATDLFKNGNVLSFDYRSSAEQTEPGFQVDVITMPRESYSFAKSYFAMNDLGNLIGRTAHKQGCSFGHDGLWYYFRDGDYKFREVLLTRDFDLALRYLGYEPERHHQGFDALEDIFEYVSGSEFFNRDIFLLENRNYQSRVRDRKRKTYTEFLKWCEERPDLPAFPYPEDKTQWLPRLFEWFEGFRADYDQAVKDLARQRAVKERFNGELVTRVTGLQGKALGALMQRFKSQFESGAALYDYVLQTEPKDLEAQLLKLRDEMGPELEKLGKEYFRPPEGDLSRAEQHAAREDRLS